MSLYLIAGATGPAKIGWSCRPMMRAASLRSQRKDPTICVYAEIRGDAWLEPAAHRAIESSRITPGLSEWFERGAAFALFAEMIFGGRKLSRRGVPDRFNLRAGWEARESSSSLTISFRASAKAAWMAAAAAEAVARGRPVSLGEWARGALDEVAARAR